MRLPAAAQSLLRRFPALRALMRRWRNPDLAAIERSQARDSGLAVLQPWTTTADDRYPLLFARLAASLGGIVAPRVLSFGCAGGEEVRALRRRLPQATIVGVDANPRALARARRRDRDPRSRYIVADRPPTGETFDAVLALAVFRHGTLGRERPVRCTAVLPFARAAEAFVALDGALRPGGVLAWGNAHFRLADLPGGDRFDLIETSADLDPVEVAYGADDRQVPADGEAGGLYRKWL
jgi:hypothetical protein